MAFLPGEFPEGAFAPKIRNDLGSLIPFRAGQAPPAPPKLLPLNILGGPRPVAQPDDYFSEHPMFITDPTSKSPLLNALRGR